MEVYFDAEKGAYVRDKSDDTIAQELNIPRVFVTAILEEAFGKIRDNSELIKLRSDLDAAKALLDEALKGYIQQVNSFYDEFHNRLRKIGG